MPRFLELDGGGGVQGNVLFWINGITIVKGWMIACGLRELALDENLSENRVKVTIYGIAKSQIRNCVHLDIWKLTQTIFDGCYHWSLFSSYEQHHMLEDDEEKTIGVSTKNNTWLLKEYRKIQMWIVLFQQNLCMMSQL
jgi:hypothetical protein